MLSTDTQESGWSFSDCIQIDLDQELESNINTGLNWPRVVLWVETEITVSWTTTLHKPCVLPLISNNRTQMWLKQLSRSNVQVECQLNLTTSSKHCNTLRQFLISNFSVIVQTSSTQTHRQMPTEAMSWFATSVGI